ncbi:FTR1 family iron permease [Yeosuana sp.]|uniref:FTR1 family iron permease n=1 Tax=Yeosuana sp. TaxID=2529388 RepID=UPI00405524A3|tara:strand:+ start:7347 stop:8903 length:1557 start_codon:yes stop_codon:yes gene_type:complete
MIIKKLKYIFFLICLLISLNPNKVSAKNDNKNEVETIIHLLDHMYKDYPLVIKDRIVLNKSEYVEMQEFSKIVYNLTEKITFPTKEKTLLLAHILDLQMLIQNKAPFLKIDSNIKFLKKEIIKNRGYKTTTAVGANTNGDQKFSTQIESSSGNSLKIASDYLISSLKNYKKGKNRAARQHALDAYLDGIEPTEASLKTYAPAFSSKLEQQMLQVRQTIEQNKSVFEVENEINRALALIVEANQVMGNSSLSYWLTFILSASILLREGLEVFLIIVLILALIQTSGVKKAKTWIHGGWLVAVAMGAAGWFLSGWLINISGQSREIMEGLISLFAVIILSFVGFWLHNNSHAEKWKIFVEEKIGKQLQKEKMFGLAVFSFVVVFREAFESILFLQAINLETIPLNKSAIGFGVLAAFGLIALLGFLFLRYSKKIPVRQLFLYSSLGISLLAVILLGKGIHSIQESGWISITKSPIFVHVDWLGIYPTIETIVSQLIFFAVLLALYYSASHMWKSHSNSNP